jgi:hypothetical protein
LKANKASIQRRFDDKLDYPSFLLTLALHLSEALQALLLHHVKEMSKSLRLYMCEMETKGSKTLWKKSHWIWFF